MAGSSQIRFSDDIFGDPNDLDDLIEGTGRDVSDGSGDEEERRRGSEAEEEGGGGGGEEGQGSDNDGENQKKDDKSDDPPKKKRKLGPRLNVNPERLKGPRGLTALLKEFDNFKFRGKGHELSDLERVLARMEHWAHRLHPKMHFEDVILKAEKVCTKKKEMQVYMKRMRMGLEAPDDGIVREEDEEAVDDPRSVQNEALTEFDKLLDDQIAYYDANPGAAGLDRSRKTPAAPSPAAPIIPKTAFALSAEQRELIARKKKEALEKRQARLKEMEEELLRQATAASLATGDDPSVHGADASEPASASNNPPPSDNSDQTGAEGARERALRNKELALERLRARRLAALGSQPPQPPPDLDSSSSSDLSIPSSPLPSPMNASTPKAPKEPANQCHETSTDDIRPPERMDEADDGANQSREEPKLAETEEGLPDSQPEESVVEGRQSPEECSSGKLPETEEGLPDSQPEESVGEGRQSPAESSPRKLPETEEGLPDSQPKESVDEGRQSPEECSSGNLPETEEGLPDSQPEESVVEGRQSPEECSSGKLPETEDAPPNIQREEPVVSADDKSQGDLPTAENIEHENSTPESDEDVLPAEKSELTPEKMEIDDEVSPKKSVSDAVEKMD